MPLTSMPGSPFGTGLLKAVALAAAVSLSAAGHNSQTRSNAAGSSSQTACSFTAGTDCSGLVTPPGFMRNWGTGAAAQQACCDRCANNTLCAAAVLATDQGGVCMLKPHGTTCGPTSSPRLLCLPSNKPPPPRPAPPSPSPSNNVPKWEPTYNMSESTVVMPCNYSGLYDYEAYPALARFGLVDYDWANAKSIWANQSPMDCDGMLVQQAARNKAQNPTAKVFVYRNIVKALPWYTQVRLLLQNRSHWGWFIPYAGCRTASGAYVCRNNMTGAIDASSNLYHDEEQTPGWTGGGNGGPDGVCHNDTKGNTGKGCNCGEGVACGEYLWDHRNGSSLTGWFTSYYIGGTEYGLGNPNVDGFYLDDSWGSAPSEEAWPCSPRGTGAGKCAGLSDADIRDMRTGWQHNFITVQTAIVNYQGFDWQNFHTMRTPSQATCATFLRDQCQNGSEAQANAVQFGMSYRYNHDHSGGNLTNFAMDLGIFMASRGPYAWLGYGWMGCGCGWEYDGKMPCDIYQRPDALDLDYGAPTGLCHETSTSSGVFVRDWTKSTVTVDCNAYKSTIQMKQNAAAAVLRA